MRVILAASVFAASILVGCITADAPDVDQTSLDVSTDRPLARHGVNHWGSLTSPNQTTWDQMQIEGVTDGDLAAIAGNGLGYLRANFIFEYQSWELDMIVERAARQNVDVLPVLLGLQSTATSFPGVYATKAAGYVKRYGRNGTFWSERPGVPYHPIRVWEIWNEPNLARSPFFLSASVYAELLYQVGWAIKQVDGNARVIIGGLAPESQLTQDPVAYFYWTVASYRSWHPGVWDDWNGVGIHPYAKTAQQAMTYLTRLRAQIDALGRTDATIWATEWGWAVERDGTALKACKLDATTASGCAKDPRVVQSELAQAIIVGDFARLLNDNAAALRLGADFYFAMRDRYHASWQDMRTWGFDPEALSWAGLYALRANVFQPRPTFTSLRYQAVGRTFLP